MPYHFQKSSSVPSDGLGLYLSTIWDTIRNHKDLNLPSQKEMLASFRCDELLLEAVQSFTATLSPVKARVKAEAISNFGTEMASLLNDALNGFLKGIMLDWGGGGGSWLTRDSMIWPSTILYTGHSHHKLGFKVECLGFKVDSLGF